MAEIKKLEKSLVEIKGEIEAAEFESYRDAALKKLGESVEIDGFRKGHVPANILEQKLPEMALLEEMAQMALSKSYGKIIADNKIDAIGYPKINITKLAKGNPLGFTITVATLPEIKLPDYKSLAKKVGSKEEKIEVTDAEFENIVKQARMIRAKEIAKGGEIDENNLPEIDDEYVKTLGGFENRADFDKKIRENILAEKEMRAKDKKRLEIIEAIISETNLEVPEVLIDSEVHKMLHKMKSDIEAMGLNYDDYLKNLKKTEEDLHKDFEKDAEKRAKLQLIVGEIAKAEKLEAPKDMVEAEVKKVTEIYKDVSPENARAYIESVLQNEEVFKFLEAQK